MDIPEKLDPEWTGKHVAFQMTPRLPVLFLLNDTLVIPPVIMTEHYNDGTMDRYIDGDLWSSAKISICQTRTCTSFGRYFPNYCKYGYD